RDLQLLDARVPLTPLGHPLADVAADVFGHALEERARRATAARTARHLRREAAQLHRLEDLLRNADFFRAVAAGTRRERHADRVADPFLQQDGEARGGCDDALHAEAGLGESEVERVVAA